MKTRVVEIEREFEVGDVFIRENGNAVVVAEIEHLPGFYLRFHSGTDLRLAAWYVNECLDERRWTYLGKVLKLGQHPEVDV